MPAGLGESDHLVHFNGSKRKSSSSRFGGKEIPSDFSLSFLPSFWLGGFFFLSYCLVPKGIIFRTLQLNPGYPQSRVSEVENKREWIEKENLYNYSLGSSAVLFPTTEPECKHPWWPRTREDDCSCQGALTASEPTCPHAEPQGEEGEEKKKKRTETSLLPPCC